ncbi:transposase [Microbacterium sp. SA39]|uniref:transposase n=1 Tax=Microbacterium sp. SA39 TaxID=1263625 RepID=UPI000B091128
MSSSVTVSESLGLDTPAAQNHLLGVQPPEHVPPHTTLFEPPHHAAADAPQVPAEKISAINADFRLDNGAEDPVRLQNWVRQAVETGAKPGVTRAEADEARELRKRVRLLEQENEVLRRAAAYFAQAHLPGK